MTKKILLPLLLLFLSSPAQATNWCSDATSIICYPIENGSGTTATDSATGHDLTFKGAGEPNWVSGASAKSYSTYVLDFDGSNDYASTADHADFNVPTNLSMVAWIRLDAYGVIGGGYLRYIFGDEGSGCSYQLVVGDYNVSGSKENLAFKGYSGSWFSVVDTTELNLSTWYHVAAVFNNTANTVTFYINGVSSSTPALNVNLANHGNTWYLGAFNTTGRVWDGYLDEVASFSDVLDSTDINDIMNKGLVQASTGYGQIIFIGNE